MTTSTTRTRDNNVNMLCWERQRTTKKEHLQVILKISESNYTIRWSISKRQTVLGCSLLIWEFIPPWRVDTLIHSTDAGYATWICHAATYVTCMYTLFTLSASPALKLVKFSYQAEFHPEPWASPTQSRGCESHVILWIILSHCKALDVEYNDGCSW